MTLERRYCEKDSPMPMEDKDKYQWGHPDAVAQLRFFNLTAYACPYCRMAFLAWPREVPKPGDYNYGKGEELP